MSNKPLTGVWDQWCVMSARPYVKMIMTDQGEEVEQTSLLNLDTCRKIVLNFGLSKDNLPCTLGHQGSTVEKAQYKTATYSAMAVWHQGQVVEFAAHGEVERPTLADLPRADNGQAPEDGIYCYRNTVTDLGAAILEKRAVRKTSPEFVMDALNQQAQSIGPQALGLAWTDDPFLNGCEINLERFPQMRKFAQEGTAMSAAKQQYGSLLSDEQEKQYRRLRALPLSEYLAEMKELGTDSVSDAARKLAWRKLREEGKLESNKVVTMDEWDRLASQAQQAIARINSGQVKGDAAAAESQKSLDLWRQMKQIDPVRSKDWLARTALPGTSHLEHDGMKIYEAEAGVADKDSPEQKYGKIKAHFGRKALMEAGIADADTPDVAMAKFAKHHEMMCHEMELSPQEREVRSNVRNFLMTATPDELKKELQISRSRGDAMRAKFIEEMLREDGIAFEGPSAIPGAPTEIDPGSVSDKVVGGHAMERETVRAMSAKIKQDRAEIEALQKKMVEMERAQKRETAVKTVEAAWKSGRIVPLPGESAEKAKARFLVKYEASPAMFADDLAPVGTHAVAGSLSDVRLTSNGLPVNFERGESGFEAGRPDEEIIRRAEELRAKNPKMGKEAAVKRVCMESPELNRAYCMQSRRAAFGIQ